MTKYNNKCKCNKSNVKYNSYMIDVRNVISEFIAIKLVIKLQAIHLRYKICNIK